MAFLRQSDNKILFALSFTLICVGFFLYFAAPAHAAVVSAANLLGQVDANSNPIWTKSVENNGPAAPNALGFNNPYDVLIDSANGRLFVADRFNNRVLAFPIDANDNFTSSTPLFVLGQSNFTSNASATTQNGFFYPSGLAYDNINGNLFVSDSQNNRVMAFNIPANATSGINGEPAIFELGQPDFLSRSTSTTQSGLWNPYEMGYDATNTRLLVGDYSHNRVMAFNIPANATSGINGEPAIFELGQTDFLSKATSTTQNGLYGPLGVKYDDANTRLFVVDINNKRVMAFNVPANATSGINDEPAIFELGQTGFTSSTANVSQKGFTLPYGDAYDPINNRLFVGENTNNRVLEFDVPANATSGINNEPATFVLGQTSFTSSTAATTQSGLYKVAGLAYDPVNQFLFVVDISNNRIMGFSVPANATSGINGELASSTLGHYGLFSSSLSTASFVNGFADDGSLINAQGFSPLTSVALDTVNHRLFVADTYTATVSNNRILVFQLDSKNNIISTIPQKVLGACDFTTRGTGAVTSSTFIFSNLLYDSSNSRLFADDGLNNRVLVFDATTSTITNCEGATFVLGQPNFTSSTASTSQKGLYFPDDQDYDPVNSRLFVSDYDNNRVMAFSVPANATSGVDGEAAIFELGQVGFTQHASTTTQTGLYGPSGISYDPVNTRLFVSDSGHNRVMAFSVPANATSGINNEPAIFELGQTNFTSSTATTTQSGLAGGTGDGPDDNIYDPTGNRLFVTDKGNHRIMVWNIPSNATSGFNGANAQNNLSQPDWSTFISGTSQSVFSRPESPHAYDPVNNRLYTYEAGTLTGTVYSGYRVLQFNFIHITNASLPSSTMSVPYSGAITVESAQGTNQTYSVISGSLPLGLSLDSSSGIISGTPTATTTATFTVETDDNFSTGPFFDRATYTMTPDPAPPSVQFVETSTTVGETSSSISIDFSISATSTATSIATFSVSGNATSGVDYTFSSTTVTFLPGTTTSSVIFTPVSDNIYGPTKTLTLTITTLTNLITGTQTTSTITIIEASPAPITNTGGKAPLPDFTINNGAYSTSNPNVELEMQVTNDIRSMAFATSSSNLASTIPIPYASIVTYSLCPSSCAPGSYTIYASFLTASGQTYYASHTIAFAIANSTPVITAPNTSGGGSGQSSIPIIQTTPKETLQQTIARLQQQLILLLKQLVTILLSKLKK